MSYDEMIRKFSPKLKAISRQVKNRHSYCDEDDFLQEAFLYLWLKSENRELDDKTDSYILQGTYYFLKNYVRRICKNVDKGSVSMYSCDERGLSIEDTLVSESYMHDTGKVEIYLLLDETEDKFTEREKDVFYYQLEGFTTREIGNKLGVSHVMVGKIEKKIREKCSLLREELV